MWPLHGSICLQFHAICSLSKVAIEGEVPLLQFPNFCFEKRWVPCTVLTEIRVLCCSICTFHCVSFSVSTHSFFSLRKCTLCLTSIKWQKRDKLHIIFSILKERKEKSSAKGFNFDMCDNSFLMISLTISAFVSAFSFS